MLINFPPNTTYPKHIHHTKSEFYFIMSGSLNIEIFNENYVTIEVIVLERGYGFLLKEGQIHTTASGGDGAIFFEIRSGPLDRDDSKIL
jgi:cupin fold WbuC family metalloprotein